MFFVFLIYKFIIIVVFFYQNKRGVGWGVITFVLCIANAPVSSSKNKAYVNLPCPIMDPPGS